MRKTFLLLFLTVAFIGCKKRTESAEQVLIGKWSTGGYEIILYNSSNAVVSHIIADAIKTYWTFNGNMLTISNDINTDKTISDYTLMQTLDKRKLYTSNIKVAGQNNWEVESEKPASMTITAELKNKSDLTYGQNQVASKGKVYVYFSKE